MRVAGWTSPNPTLNLGARTAPTRSRGSTGAQTMPKNKPTHQPQSNEWEGTKVRQGSSIKDQTWFVHTRQSLSAEPTPLGISFSLKYMLNQCADKRAWAHHFQLWLVHCFIEAIFGHSWGPGVSTRAGRGRSSLQFFRGARAVPSSDPRNCLGDPANCKFPMSKV